MISKDNKLGSLKVFLSSMRNRHFLIVDCLIFILTPILSIFLRYERPIDLLSIQTELVTIIIFFGAFKFFVFRISGLYRILWKYASIDELVKIVISVILVTFGQIIIYSGITTFNPFFVSSIPRSIPIIDGVLTLVFVGGLRFSARISGRINLKKIKTKNDSLVLIVGAGEAGVMIAEEMHSNPQLHLHPVGFIDDDPKKMDLKIRGIPVLGNREAIPALVQTLGIQQIIIAMPKASGNVMKDINNICKPTGIPTKTIPGVFELLSGSANIAKLRDIVIDDLLRRDPVVIDDSTIQMQLTGKRILITGAGGSIGSELCRQVARFKPAQLILLGHGENSIYHIVNNISHLFPNISFSTVLADIRDRQRIHLIMKRYRPELVFHAAAHKHVPLMELNPAEAITNNIIGTRNVVDAAIEFGVERFVLISTDKAVNPTSVMGASKRVAELIVQNSALRSKKDFIAVRFGNVLGSRGSVIPLFKDQISRGGPITVTHPEVKRYFMTIPEAVQLVLQASIIGAGGEVFMLDMGEPVKIVDLAKDMIQHFYTGSQKDIEIVFTGLRPGEKLFEELILDNEHFEKTIHDKIFVLRNGKTEAYKEFDARIDQLKRFAVTGNATEILRDLKELVPEFQYQIPQTSI